MVFEALELKDRVGSEIRTDVASLLTPEVAGKVRRLLVERGVRLLGPAAGAQACGSPSS